MQISVIRPSGKLNTRSSPQDRVFFYTLIGLIQQQDVLFVRAFWRCAKCPQSKAVRHHLGEYKIFATLAKPLCWPATCMGTWI